MSKVPSTPAKVLPLIDLGDEGCLCAPDFVPTYYLGVPKGALAFELAHSTPLSGDLRAGVSADDAGGVVQGPDRGASSGGLDKTANGGRDCSAPSSLRRR